MLEFQDISATLDDKDKRYLHLEKSQYIFYHVDLITVFDYGLKIQKRMEYTDLCIWCDNNFKNNYRSSFIELNAADQGGIAYEIYFAFESDDQAVAFKLRWL